MITTSSQAPQNQKKGMVAGKMEASYHTLEDGSVFKPQKVLWF
jgi:hypothetical protein